MERIIVHIIFLVAGLILIGLGYIVHKLKQYDLIAGYNTMPDDKKENFDITRYARHFGIVFYLMGIVTILLSVIEYLLSFDGWYFGLSFMGIILGGTIYLIVLGYFLKNQSGIRKNL